MARNPVIPTNIGRQAWSEFLQTAKEIAQMNAQSQSRADSLAYQRERDDILDKRYADNQIKNETQDNVDIVLGLKREYESYLLRGDYSVAAKKLDLAIGERDRRGVTDGRVSDDVLTPLKEDLVNYVNAEKKWKNTVLPNLKWKSGEEFDTNILEAIKLDESGYLSSGASQMLYTMSQSDEEKWIKHQGKAWRSATGSLINLSKKHMQEVGWAGLSESDKKHYNNLTFAEKWKKTGLSGREIYEQHFQAGQFKDSSSTFLTSIRTIYPGLETAEGFGKFYKDMPKAFQKEWKLQIAKGIMGSNPNFSQEQLTKELCSSWQIGCENLKTVKKLKTTTTTKGKKLKTKSDFDLRRDKFENKLETVKEEIISIRDDYSKKIKLKNNEISDTISDMAMSPGEKREIVIKLKEDIEKLEKDRKKEITEKRTKSNRLEKEIASIDRAEERVQEYIEGKPLNEIPGEIGRAQGPGAIVTTQGQTIYR